MAKNILYGNAMEDSNNNYLALISNQALQDGILSDDDALAIQMKLFSLLAKRTHRYTMDDSSSVPIEIAENLYQSICFSISLFLKQTGNSIILLKNTEPEQLLKAAWAEIESQIKIGEKLLKLVKTTSPKIDNKSYIDTLKEIGNFFKVYDYRFYAHEIPCDIDYQLCHAVNNDLQGIEYINEYLRRLLIENEFCSHFDKELIIALLRSYCPDYKGLLINLYEPIAVNAFALALLQEDIFALDITDFHRGKLLRDFNMWSRQHAETELCKAANQICNILQIKNTEKIEYLKNTALNIYPRVAATLPSKCLDQIFLSLSYKLPDKIYSVSFFDKKQMDDEELIKLIDEINNCSSVFDKIALLKEKVHSLQDLVEVLSDCFWGEECFALFETFEDAELNLLQFFLDNKPEQWTSNTAWETQYFNYIKTIKK
ncbi:MAG: hypothetical protein GYA50_09295 [Eubacteriaceae bacterium]|nr:hypothetical protein [Eubacteriaceae bacterium]